ncbi:MAG: hypothetical protein VW338_02400 [Rhodospirillaceae bacterium]
MAKEPGSRQGDGASPSPEDARADFWEATFFSPDGKQVGNQSAERPARETTAEPSEQRAVPAQRPAGTPTDEAEADAYKRRISREAFSDVEQEADDLGEALHAKFMSLLTAKIEEKDGQITADDVQEMGDEFRENLEDIKTAFLKAVKTYTLARKRRRVESARSDHFTRLLVRKFEHRFRDERKLQADPSYLSRRMIPGFSNMLSLMFGNPQLASYEKRVNAVIERLKHENRGELDWEMFYRSPEIKKLMLRAEIEIAQNFRNVEKRLTWMVAMINSNLIPADEHLMGTEWTFNEEAATRLLAALFSDLRAALRNENARDRFAESLGNETITTLEKVAARFH